MIRYILTKTGSVESFVQICEKFKDATAQMENNVVKDKYHLDGFSTIRKKKWGYTARNGAEFSKFHIYKVNMI